MTQPVRCDECRFVRRFEDNREDNMGTLAECVRYPPDHKGRYSLVHMFDWCGEAQ